MARFAQLSSLALTALALTTGCVIVIDKSGGEGEPMPGSGSSEPYPGEDPGVEPGGDPGSDPGSTECDDIAFASVIVHTIGPDGAPVRATNVMWSTGVEESPMPAECMDEACTTWIAGWEQPGDFVLYGFLSENTEDPCCWLTDDESVSVTVPMGEDGCHVVTQEIDMVLDATELVCADAECG